nr:MAG TPA: hypothetical protein [Caudoviricetes sp.]
MWAIASVPNSKVLLIWRSTICSSTEPLERSGKMQSII